MAFYSVEPFGEARADLRNAQLMALLANINRDAQRRPTAYTPREFLPDWWTDAPATNTVLDKFRAIAARVNARNAEVDNAGN